MVRDGETRRLAAIMAADVVGYSALMGRDGAGTLSAIRALRKELWGPKIEEYGGRVVKLTGDGQLTEFPSVADAVQHAVEVQRAMRRRNADIPEDHRIVLRIGINLGDVIVDGDDIYGDGVNVAARLEEIAEPGGISISRSVHDQIRDKLLYELEDLGEQQLKNIARPTRVFRVSIEETGDAIGPKTSAPAARPPTAAATARWRMPAIAAGIVVAAVLGGLALWDTYLRPAPVETASEKAPAAVLRDRLSIAILPFVNMSGDPEQDYFSDGLTEDLITDLSKISGLFVVSRGAVFRYKGIDASPEKVAKALGIRHVLEGSVRRAGGRVRINAQLVDASTGGHLWAERYDRELKDIFDVQDEITGKIVAALKLRLTKGEQQRVERRDTDNLEAYDSFLRGRVYYWRFSKEMNSRARQSFQRAIELDPKYGAAYAELAHTYFQEWLFRYSKDPEALERGLEAGQRAVAVDETSPLAHTMLGWIYLWKKQHEPAIAEMKRAIALDPNYADAHTRLAEALNWAGRAAEGLPYAKKAMRLDPLYPFYFPYHLGRSYQLTQQYDEAIAAMNEVLARKPKFLPAFSVNGDLWRIGPNGRGPRQNRGNSEN